MPDLQVDLASLEEFGIRLVRIAATLDSSRSTVDAHAEALGPGRAQRALRDFEDHWRDGRRHVANDATTLSSMATESVATYRQADEALAAGLRDAGRG